MRYERKYRIDHMSMETIQQLILMHPASFRAHYPDRQINNLYLDTPDLRCWYQNVHGENQRKKYRLRWYGEMIQDFISAVFETKIKHNELGWKESEAMEACSFSALETTIPNLLRSNPQLPYLKGALFNSYLRSYFITSDGRFRLTLDRRMHYFSPHHALPSRTTSFTDPAFILELKYEKEYDDQAGLITQGFPLRQSKHSKYVYGIQAIG